MDKAIHERLQQRGLADKALTESQRMEQYKLQSEVRTGVEMMIAVYLAERMADFEEWMTARGIDPYVAQAHFHWIEKHGRTIEDTAAFFALMNPEASVIVIDQGLLNSVVLKAP